MEGSLSKLNTNVKKINSKHLFIEDTNLISSVDINSLCQELSHSLDIATDTTSEKLLLRIHRHKQTTHSFFNSHNNKEAIRASAVKLPSS
jgi:hypothetical protein